MEKVLPLIGDDPSSLQAATEILSQLQQYDAYTLSQRRNAVPDFREEHLNKLLKKTFHDNSISYEKLKRLATVADMNGVRKELEKLRAEARKEARKELDGKTSEHIQKLDDACLALRARILVAQAGRLGQSPKEVSKLLTEFGLERLLQPLGA